MALHEPVLSGELWLRGQGNSHGGGFPEETFPLELKLRNSGRTP